MDDYWTDYWAYYGPAFLFVLVGVVVLTSVFISQINNSFAIIVALIALALFTLLIISQIDRLISTRWTFLDLIIVLAVCFMVIWIIPDIRNIIIRWKKK